MYLLRLLTHLSTEIVDNFKSGITDDRSKNTLHEVQGKKENL
jgi:hypothetical protein